MRKATSDERSVTAAQTGDVPRPYAGSFELVVLEQRSVTRRTLTPPGPLCIGRADGCDVLLQDPAASRRHALLHVAGELAIEDLDSRNGTRVRGGRLSPHQRTHLHPGDAVHIGGAILLVQEGEGADGRQGAMTRTGIAARGAPVVGQDPEMHTVNEWISRAGPSNITVLILGETGVGKEVVAEAIHHASGARSRKPLLRINCAALSSALLESELFGHERGAFTGAARDKPGLFEAAHGGTVFLDEIGELPLEAQAKLLRVLETREVLRVGAVKPRRVDVRFIAASNRDLRAEVTRGAFRQDLFFRLHAVSIVVPPLRRRPADLEALAVHFIDAFCRYLDRPTLALAPASLDGLRRYSWPGNVRELRNVVECAVLRAEGSTIEVADLPLEVASSGPPAAMENIPSDFVVQPVGAPTTPPLSDDQQAERERIVRALATCHGNQTRAAEQLAMPRRTFVARLTAYGIPRPRTPRSDPGA